ncbi:MAG: MMPL family transporter [Clostridiales bacterium]|nr:MMPL family transporter [Clostridiales bacterium]
MRLVKVEYDITSYLPDNTDTKKALEMMDDEFATYGSTTVMIKNISFDAAARLCAEMREIDGVKDLPFDNTAAYYKDGCAKLSITFVGSGKDGVSTAAYDKVIEKLNGSGYSYVVPSPLNDNYADVLAHEVVIILAIAAGVILLVLLFTSKSFAEIIAFPIVFIVAAVLNMGSNFILGKISFVSNTVCIILQLALAIDYSIILCHRFTEEKDLMPDDHKLALVNALTKAIPEISSSSLTTISGLVALMFMQLRLGYDLGIVLAKSIVCSLLTVFFLMPGILMLLSKIMDKSRHRNFVPKLRFWGKGVVKARYVLIPVFVVLFGLGAWLSQNVTYVYSTDTIDTSRPPQTRIAKQQTEEVFGYSNAFVILVPKGDYERERIVIQTVGAEEKINSALGIAGVEVADGVYLTDGMTYREFSDNFGIGTVLSRTLFGMYAEAHGDSTLLIGSYRVPLIDLLDYAFENEELLDNLSAEQREQILGLKDTLKSAEEQLIGKHYSRLVFNIDGPVEGDETFAMIERLIPIVKGIYPDAIFAGSSMSAYDLNQSFSSDNILITTLTIVFIYIILAFTFRSFGIPIILVLVIQGAIFINFSLSVLMGTNLYFFTYLIISAIQMGATIDYAILLTNRFRQLKVDMPKREAMIQAVSGAFPTVFTSGTIMCVAGFLIGGITTDPLIASMGLCLGRGTIISILGVLVILPALLFTLDPVLEKTVLKKNLFAFLRRKKETVAQVEAAAPIDATVPIDTQAAETDGAVAPTDAQAERGATEESGEEV